jgi:hypothetical protein
VEAIAKAGAGYVKGRLGALQKCRNTINKGRLAIDPADCVDEAKTAAAIAKAGAKARKLVAAKCTDALLSFDSCAQAVDGIVNVAGAGGCLIETHDAAVEAMLAAEYGSVTPGETSERKCQEAIAKAGADYGAQRMKGIQKCRSAILRGKLALAAADCASESTAAAAIGKAAGKARARVAKFCSDTLLDAIGPCATTVDGVITPAGDAGCLIESHDAAVSAMLNGQWGG